MTSKHVGRGWSAFCTRMGTCPAFLLRVPFPTCMRSSIPRSDRAHVHVRTLATRHPRTKFVSIIGDKCIPDLPDTRIPMFIVYRKGQIVTQITAWGLGRERTLEGGPFVATISQKSTLTALQLQNWRHCSSRQAPSFRQGDHQQTLRTIWMMNPMGKARLK
jgi:hypothetical protein